VAPEIVGRWRRAAPVISYCRHVTLYRGNLIEIERKARAASGTLCLDQLLSGIVQANEQLLQMTEIGGVQAFNRGGANRCDAAEPGHDPAQLHYWSVRLVRPDARIAGYFHLVASRRETHRALAMERARIVDVPERQRELEFRLQHTLLRGEIS
jgi:hypothetical protein